jgi:hypothetical protein
MAKCTDPDQLVVSTTSGNLGVDGNLWIDTSAKTISLAAYGDLVAKDGVTLQALYSKLIKLWELASYNKYPFGMYAIDALSGQFQFGTDGGSYNGWKPANDTTRQMLRDGGWSEYSAAGALNRQYVGIVALASGFPAGAQFYYQKASGGAAANFTFTDSPNQGIQVYGDAANGDFDNRTYFKIFCREYNYTYDDANLTDVGATGTGAFKVSLPVAVGSDLKIQAADGSMAGAPYSGIDVTYYGTDQNKTIGAGSYPFRKIIDGNNATLEQIYTKIQYLLRQDADIDEGGGTVNGKTESQLCYFVGDTLYTTQGVFIENIQANDLNRVVFLDQNSVQRTYPYSAAGSLVFNSFLSSGSTGYYRMYFANDDAGDNSGDDYGTATAITVNDKDGSPIAGAITSGQISFTYDYDGNVQRGAGSDAEDAPIVVVAGNKGVAKPVVATGTITRAKGITISLVAEQDRAYTA